MFGILAGSIFDCSEGDGSYNTSLIQEDVEHITEADGCEFLINYQQSWIDKKSSLSIYEGGPVGTPININVTKDGQLIIYLTDLTAIVNAPLAISKDGDVVFHATDSNNQLVLGQFSIYEREASTRIAAAALPRAFTQFIWNNWLETPTLYGVDGDNHLYEVGAESLTNLLPDDVPPASTRTFTLLTNNMGDIDDDDPTHFWLATNTMTQTTLGENTETLGIIDLTGTAEVFKIPQEAAGLTHYAGGGDRTFLWSTRKNGDTYKAETLFPCGME